MATTASQQSRTDYSLGPFKVPLALSAALIALSFLPWVQDNSTLVASFWGAVAVLLTWSGYQLLTARRSGEAWGFRVFLRPQHYVQAMVQFSVYAYWGFFWRPVYEHAWLIVAQILFAYAFDILLSWSRKRDYTLGFGPVPIILSINLFLWFRDDWFYMQFLMIALGFLGKEYVRWEREGRNVHIFNPSAFALGLFSLVLITTGTTGLTWGQEIASTLTLAPNIYTYLFLVGLVVMYFFSITLVAGMAAITLLGFSALYSATTGVPYFLDSGNSRGCVPGSAPCWSLTRPRRRAHRWARLIFGVLYGLGVFALYTLLGAIGVPTFYDKLLCVPLLNLSVIAIDHGVRRIKSETITNVWRESWFGGRGNLAHMSVWIAVFALMTILGKMDGRHAGDSLPFWQQACAEGRPNSCERLVQLRSTYCNDNAAWACNELGALYREGEVVDADPDRALAYFSRACELKFHAPAA